MTSTRSIEQHQVPNICNGKNCESYFKYASGGVINEFRTESISVWHLKAQQTSTFRATGHLAPANEWVACMCALMMTACVAFFRTLTLLFIRMYWLTVSTRHTGDTPLALQFESDARAAVIVVASAQSANLSRNANVAQDIIITSAI
eukprot:4775885-Amphidinium_carterae.1